MTSKKKLTIICSHRPSQDPRVIWVADSCRQRFETSLIGLSEEAVAPQEGVVVNHGRLTDGSIIDFSRELLSQLFMLSTFHEKIILFLFLVFGIVASPVIVCLFLAMNYFLVRKPGRENTDSAKNTDSLTLKQRLVNSMKSWGFVRDVGMFVMALRLFVRANASLLHHLRGKGEIDIIYANDFECLAAAVIYKRHFPKTRVVYDCHEFWPHSHATRLRFHPYVFSFLERILMRQADSIFTVNELLALKMSNVYGQTIDYIYNAAPLNSNIEPTRVKADDGGPLKLIFQGNYSRFRGLEELVAAWEQGDFNGKATLTLRGPQSTIYARDFVAHCRQLSCFNKNLFVLDPVNEEQLIEALDGFHVGVIPYRPVDLNFTYACPNKLSQYLQVGLAILTNKTEFLKTVVDREQVGLVYDSDNPATFIQCVQRLIEDRELLHSLRSRAKSYAKDSYNWQNQESKLLRLIDAA